MRRRGRLGLRQIKLLALGCFATSGILAGFAGYDRAAPDPSTSVGGVAFLRFLSLVLVVAGTILSVRVVDILLLFDEKGARRRALASLILGIALLLLSCVLFASPGSGKVSQLLEGFGQGLLFAGIGVFLSGLIGSMWVFGGSYAADRIEKLNEDDW